MMGSIVVVLLSIALIFCLHQSAEAKLNRHYYMPSSYCGNVREIDGAVIASAANSLYSHSACVMKFMSSDNFITTKRIQVSIKYLQLSCSTTLKIYDGSGTTGMPMASFTCHSNFSKFPLYKTTQKYLSLRLNNNGDMSSKFKLVLTTYKRPSYCSEFRCNNGLCIDKDLRCDGVDHCADNSDESYCTRRTYYFNTGSLAGVIIAVLVLIFIVTVFIFIRRRRMMRGHHNRPPVSMAYQAPASTAGTYPTQPTVQPMGYAPPPPNAYGDASVPGYAPQYPPQQGYPVQPMPGYPTKSDPGFNYNAPPPAYYQATGGQPPYPPQVPSGQAPYPPQVPGGQAPYPPQ